MRITDNPGQCHLEIRAHALAARALPRPDDSTVQFKWTPLSNDKQTCTTYTLLGRTGLDWQARGRRAEWRTVRRRNGLRGIVRGGELVTATLYDVTSVVVHACRWCQLVDEIGCVMTQTSTVVDWQVGTVSGRRPAPNDATVHSMQIPAKKLFDSC